MILPEISQEWKTGLSLAWSGYIAVLSVWIVMQKRAPVSTMSWILSLALLPFAGFVVYYFLGPQRMKKQRLKRLRSQAALYGETDFARLRDAAADAPAVLRQLARLGTASCDLPISTAVRVDLLVDGAAHVARCAVQPSKAGSIALPAFFFGAAPSPSNAAPVS